MTGLSPNQAPIIFWNPSYHEVITPCSYDLQGGQNYNIEYVPGEKMKL